MSKLQVKQDVFNDMGVGAGLILTSAPTVDQSTNVIKISDSQILGATRGGITFNPNPQSRTRVVDGVASNTVGAHIYDRYEPTISGTFITQNLAVLLKAVGFGDIASQKIVARHEPSTSEDYKDLWFVQRISGGGSQIVKLCNAICTSGSAIKSNDNGETEIPLTFVGNYTLADQDTPPFEIEIVPAPVTPTPEPTPEPEEPEEPADNNAQE